MKKQVIRDLPVTLTEDEKLEIGEKQAKTVQEKEMLEFQFDRVRKDWKGKISETENKIHDYARLINDGFETRQVDCQWDYSWDKNKKNLVRMDTAEVIESQPISPEERQQEMKIVND